MTSEKFISVQYLRAFAATLVVVFHAFSIPAIRQASPFAFGQFGVELFFVISGFVMWITTQNREKSPVEFWKARVIRIVPLYWFFTSLFVVCAAKGLTSTPATFDAVYILKSYFFIPASNPISGLPNPVYSLGWTLNYEMFFYLIFGWTLLIGNTSMRLATVLAALLSLVLLGVIVRPTDPILATYTAPIILDFAAGVVIARFASFFVRLGRVTGLFLLAAGIAMFFVPNPLGFAVGSTCLVGGAVALEPQVQRSPSLSLLFLGNASYSIYLAHPFAQRAFAVALTHLKLSTALMLVLGTGAGVIGALAYVLIERPLMAWLRKLRWPAQSDNRAVAGTKLD
jgi:peptidoglycan/LPS O-acetylase OafA/YrhL